MFVLFSNLHWTRIIQKLLFNVLESNKIQLRWVHDGCLIRAGTAYPSRAPHFTPRFLVGSVLLVFLVFCVALLCVFTFSVLWCPLRFTHKNDVRFVFTSSCLKECSCLIYVICVYFRIVVANTYCVVFLLCLPSSYVP